MKLGRGSLARRHRTLCQHGHVTIKFSQPRTARVPQPSMLVQRVWFFFGLRVCFFKVVGGGFRLW